MKAGDIFLMKLRGIEVQKLFYLDKYILEPVTTETQFAWAVWLRENRN